MATEFRLKSKLALAISARNGVARSLSGCDPVKRPKYHARLMALLEQKKADVERHAEELDLFYAEEPAQDTARPIEDRDFP